jgi:hypothetical protein
VPPKNRRSAARTLSPAALRGALTIFQSFHARRGTLTLVQLRSLHKLLVHSADSLYRLADRVERDPRVRVHRSLLDEVADRVERLEPADDPVVAPVCVAISGAAVLTRLPIAQVNEVLAKCVAHNLCCVVKAIFTAGLAPTFWPDAVPTAGRSASSRREQPFAVR